MSEHSGSENGDTPQVDWEDLENELSAGALESLRQHIQHQGGATAAAGLGGREEGAEEENAAGPSSALDSSSSSGRGGSGGGRQTATTSPPVPKSNLVYKAKDYWDSRFAEEESYDWLASYSDVAERLHDEIPRDARVLIVGCGNSSLSADMYDDGYRDLLSTDFSEVVIEKMRAKHHLDRPGMRWERMDMLALDAEDASFDAVVDKAAMDALMVDKGDPWNPDPATVERCHKTCAEVSRVLVPGGVFVQLSFEQVHFRRKFLLGEHVRVSAAFSPAPAAGGGGGGGGGGTRQGSEQDGDKRGEGGGGVYGWDMRVHDVQQEAGCFGHFLYVLRKRGGE